MLNSYSMQTKHIVCPNVFDKNGNAYESRMLRCIKYVNGHMWADFMHLGKPKWSSKEFGNQNGFEIKQMIF